MKLSVLLFSFYQSPPNLLLVKFYSIVWLKEGTLLFSFVQLGQRVDVAYVFCVISNNSKQGMMVASSLRRDLRGHSLIFLDD